MGTIRKKMIIGLLLTAALCTMAACGKPTSGEDGGTTPTPEITATVAPEPSETTVTPGSTDRVTPAPTPSPTPEPAHTPAKQEGIEIPEEYRKIKKGHEGTVESITYKTKNYYGDGQEIEKPGYVYLPYGYDETKQYNVLYLLHNDGGDEKTWGLHNQFSSVRLAMDNLVYYGDVEPFIIVTLDGIPREGFMREEAVDEAYGGLVTELRNDLIPYIEANYATYADYDEAGYDMAAARDHRAIAGGSFGAMQTIDIGLCECLDLFSYFGPFSLAQTVLEPEEMAEKINAFEGYEIHLIYSVSGDGERDYVYTCRYLLGNLDELTDKVEAGENLFMNIVKGGHGMDTWSLGFYNFAQVIFKTDATQNASDRKKK